MNEPIRVLLVDDHNMVRIGLKAYFSTLDDIQVIGEASTGAEAVRMVGELVPDVVLMDLKMPGMDGFEATRQIKTRRLARSVVALTIYGDDSAREQAAQVGVDAFVEKGTSIRALAETIRKFNL